MSGFEAKYRLSGAGFTIKQVLAAGTATLQSGDLLTLSAGSASLGGSAGSGFLGACLSNVKSLVGGRVSVITDEDVVYGVTDANARKIGDPLGLVGASGAQSVVSDGGKQFVVVEDSRSDEPTKVRFNTGKHYFNTAQT